MKKTNRNFNNANIFKGRGSVKQTPKTKNEFAEVAPISGGNLYPNRMEIDAMRDVVQGSIRETRKPINFKSPTNTVSDTMNTYFASRTIQPYFLLQLQADYFCNTIKYAIKDYTLAGKIIKIIRNAFINGMSGLYIDKDLDKVYPVNIVECGVNIYGEVDKIVWSPIDSTLASREQPNFKTNGITTKTVKGVEKCSNIKIFKWGTMGYSSWIIIWPFINQQADFLMMIQAQMFSFTKKFVYKVQDPSTVKDEMEMYFNPKAPFMITTSLGVNENKFEQLDIDNKTSGIEIIEYYNKLIEVYYALYGRRINSDAKQQNNLTDEVEAGQEQYDTVQKDWLNQFQIFAYDVNSLIPDAITIKTQEQAKKEKDAETNNQGERGHNDESK